MALFWIGIFKWGRFSKLSDFFFAHVQKRSFHFSMRSEEIIWIEKLLRVSFAWISFLMPKFCYLSGEDCFGLKNGAQRKKEGQAALLSVFTFFYSIRSCLIWLGFSSLSDYLMSYVLAFCRTKMHKSISEE